MDSFTFYLIFVSMALKITSVTTLAQMQIRIVKFVNDAGHLKSGKCCVENKNGACTSPCNTYFYMSDIDNPDIFKKTAVYKNNSLVFLNTSNEMTFFLPVQPLQDTFTVKIEVFHHNKENDEKDSLIVDMIISDELTRLWTEKTVRRSGMELTVVYRFKCWKYYYGKNCDKYCQDDEHSTCTPDGTKLCKSGWKGESCNEPICAEGCSELKGYCIHPGECICYAGWKGVNCTDCEVHPSCVHGYCVKPYECVCYGSWKGIHCNQRKVSSHDAVDDDPCAGIICKNDGTCQRNGTSFYCACKPGYEGLLCENKVVETCTDYCKNGGTCLHIKSRLRVCLCPPGWTGKMCEIALNSCLTFPCQNNGTCIERFDEDFVCKCPPQFTGSHCQFSQSKPEVRTSNNVKIASIVASTVIVLVLLGVIYSLTKNISAVTREASSEEMTVLNPNLNNELVQKNKCDDKKLLRSIK